MSECTHDCSSCGESCASREPQSLLKAHHADAHVGKVYGIVSGKGGVGKSMVTSQLAVTMRRRGYQVGILDADITGPSIPKAFGIHDRAMGTENALIPSESKTGIQVMSINLLLENETDPVIWRGPVISGVVQQFWTDVLWNCDYLFVDMPPGTGDVPAGLAAGTRSVRTSPRAAGHRNGPNRVLREPNGASRPTIRAGKNRPYHPVSLLQRLR